MLMFSRTTWLQALLLAQCFFFASAVFADSFKVTSVKGKVLYRPKGELKAVPVVEGAELKEGGRLKVAMGGFVAMKSSRGDDIEFKDKAYVKLASLPSADQKSTSMTMFSGKSQFKVKPLSKGEVFEVRSPTAVAGVRGTIFSMLVTDSGTTAITVMPEVRNGVPVASKVVLTNSKGQQVVISAGQSGVVSASGKMSKTTTKKSSNSNKAKGSGKKADQQNDEKNTDAEAGTDAEASEGGTLEKATPEATGDVGVDVSSPEVGPVEFEVTSFDLDGLGSLEALDSLAGVSELVANVQEQVQAQQDQQQLVALIEAVQQVLQIIEQNTQIEEIIEVLSTLKGIKVDIKDIDQVGQ